MMVIGHLNEAVNIVGNNIREKVIIDCLQNDKGVYCFDDLPQFYDMPKFFHPKLEKRNVRNFPAGRLYRSNTPVIGVFGTSSRQGKFTLQLYLRERFITNGYSVGQKGTEPTAPLFGMDSCFHYGYNSKNPIQRGEVVQYINSCYKELEERDIIIVGGQSCLVTPDNGNISHFTFPQYDFFMACSPDAIILCVNTFDSQETIQKTIQFSEAAAFGKVIALVVFPLKRVSIQSAQLMLLPSSDYNDVRSQYTRTYGYPVYVLGDLKDMDKLYQDCICFFTGEEKNVSFKRGKEISEVTRIIFPGYIFIKSCLAETAFLIIIMDFVRKTSDILKLLNYGSYKKIAVNEIEINFLLDLCNDNYCIEYSKGLIEGDRVKVIEGPIIRFIKYSATHSRFV
ncbi:MAG: DUF1611 domain-containing protein [Clostridia bacterium]|nr:DUF1611 domain-containing protein [Clostridia bacterium]